MAVLNILSCTLHPCYLFLLGFPGGSIKNSPANAGDKSSTPGGGSPGGGNGYLLQYSCLGNPMDRGDWRGHKRVGHDLKTKQTCY